LKQRRDEHVRDVLHLRKWSIPARRDARENSTMMNFPESIDAYLSGGEVLRRSVAGSTLECVAHIADFEPVLAERMKRIISHDRPLLLVADENLFAAALCYHERDLGEELALIDLTRKEMGRILRSLPNEAASRVGIHSYKGLVTLEAVLAGTVNHLLHHSKFIDEKKKALGV
jgi:DinB superfamily